MLVLMPFPYLSKVESMFSLVSPLDTLFPLKSTTAIKVGVLGVCGSSRLSFLCEDTLVIGVE